MAFARLYNGPGGLAMARLIALLWISLLLACSKDVVPTDSRADENLPYPSDPAFDGAVAMSMTVGDSALEFFAAATKDQYYRDSVFPARLVVYGENDSFTYKDVRVNLHGESSLLAPYKSFEVKLPSRVPPFGTGVALRKFLLIAMAEDTGYYRNFLSYVLTSQLDSLFLGEFRYTRFILNGRDQGLYLLVERAQDAIERHYPEAITFRRGYDNDWEPKGQIKDNLALLDEAIAELKNFYLWQQALSPEEFYDSLKQHVDMDSYYHWLAFNRLILNGDYTDEVYFYKKAPTDKQWKVYPWDFENTFGPPHGGNALEGSWVYCVEQWLDYTIATTPAMTADYLDVLRGVADSMDAVTLRFAFARLESELLPWFQDIAVATINNNFNDDPTQAYQILSQELKSREQELLLRRDTLLSIP